jgi:catechol 2,3-dioxygenase-like lactoylglutathione lyase family enzyme
VSGRLQLERMQTEVGADARLSALPDRGHVLVELRDGAALGDVMAALRAAGARVEDCRRRSSEAEAAFLAVARRAEA